jgi:small GTP-binding protein
LQRLLSTEQLNLLRQERALLEDVRVLLARMDAPDEDQALVKRGLEQLDELFLLVVVGEFNAGKTAFLNAMLGGRLLTEGVTPTTAQINLLRYGDQKRSEHVGEDYLVLYLPVDWLREINLVDTPGTNAVIQRHQQITETFIPQSDLVLFITSADRPFSESERAFLERIREWGKKVVFVVNKIDIIDSPADRETVLNFVRENARQLLGVEPVVFPVSAKLAQQAKFGDADSSARGNGAAAPAGDAWEASHFGPLEEYLLKTLDTGERLRLKLENPIGVAARLVERALAQMLERQSVLKADFETLDSVDDQLAAYEEDMRRDFQYQFSRVDNVLYAMAERGDLFFDETLRLGRIFDLMNAQKISNLFQSHVVGDTSRDLERHVGEMIDWMVEKDFRQWRAVTDYLNRRWTEHSDRIVGTLGKDFELSRQTLLQSVGREAQRVIESYDRAGEAAKLSEEVQRALMHTAAIQASAVGLGALLVAALHTTLLDITGILGASALAALGLYLLPYRRTQLKAQLRTNINSLRERMREALTRQFDAELEVSLRRIREAIAPYTRFVRVEREKIERLQTDLTAARQQIESIRAGIQRLDGQ